MTFHALPFLQLLGLVLIANGVPVLAYKLLGERWARPLDQGRILPDGQPVLGPSKTLRGVLLGVGVTTLVAPLVKLPWELGLQVGIWAMLGDLCSSLIRRRLKRPPGSPLPVFDQLPESLFPGLAVREALALSGWDIAATVVTFTAIDLVLSRRLPQLRR